MKSVKYHPDARTEAVESALFYEDRQEGLGYRFLAAVEDRERFIRSLPNAGTPSDEGTRRFGVRKFPFALVYKEYDDHILIVAVAHYSRKPGYWKARL